MMSFVANEQTPGDVIAKFDLYLLRPGLWQMHGKPGHYWTSSFKRQREAVAGADHIARANGCHYLILRFFNHWKRDNDLPSSDPADPLPGRLSIGELLRTVPQNNR
jgi:hypothetical protein